MGKKTEYSAELEENTGRDGDGGQRVGRRAERSADKNAGKNVGNEEEKDDDDDDEDGSHFLLRYSPSPSCTPNVTFFLITFTY
ncbi:hypothetical protein AGMMS50293_31340 [Spirochaetia bacterium]|nr:hypothetical protein AGMMS50293_31340 [Spirochaetia bacterium]